MTVTAVEFRSNMSKYFICLLKEDICITRHGKVIGILTDPNREKRQRAQKAGEPLQKKFEEYTRLTREYLEKVAQLMEEK